MNAETLYRAHINGLRRFLRRILRSEEDAEDVAHEAMANVLRMMESTVIERPRTLLFTAAYRTAIDRLRRRRLEHALFDSGAESDDAPCAEPSQEYALETREDLCALIAALNRLAPLRRRVLLLSRIEGLSYREIAKRTGLSVNAIEKHVARALRACRRDLAAA